MKDGFLKIASATPDIRVADCTYNAASVVKAARKACRDGAGILLLPELCLTAYTCGDLFRDSTLLRSAERSLLDITKQTAGLDMLIVLGLPVADGAELYNCAAVLSRGEILGFVPKSNIPNYSEFYEARHFTPGPDYKEINFSGRTVPLGTHLLFQCRSMPELTVGIEICEDLWVADPASSKLALNGATVLLNPSASDETIGKAEYRRALVKGQSARLLCAYVYADAGEGESTTDLVFTGHNLIAENGLTLAESKRFVNEMITADIDVQRIVAERRRMTTFVSAQDTSMHRIDFDLNIKECKLTRTFAPLPFVPESSRDLMERCEEIFSLQVAGLKKRLMHTGCKNAVIGVSGGLDSTLALLVTVRAFDALKLDRKGITAVSMPGFGTTGRTKSNASVLAEQLGAELKEISISAAVTQHFADIGHNPRKHDVTYENSQARERTQILMDIANQSGGIVIGTGDLSELALGWATYNGDHMSMYAVNCSIPKTLVRHLVSYEARISSRQLRGVLQDILDTPVSPELLPPVDGVISQKTESIVGPYELHDFFLYYMLRFGFKPSKIHRIAVLAFKDQYSPAEIKKWLTVFYTRFFAQQFKRSCLPDGPKVGSVTLSPRGDWRMPSDACAAEWMKDLENCVV